MTGKLQQTQQHPALVRLRSLCQKIKQHPVGAILVFVGSALGIALIVVAVLGYWLNWHWTGLVPETSEPKQHAKTLWDWLQLLIIPAAIAFGGLWFSGTQRKAERDQENRAEQKALLRELRSNIIQAYSAAKRVRRLLRGTAQCLPPGQKEIMIKREPYEKQMEALIDIQLQFETFKDEVENNPTLFPGKAQLDTIKRELGSIEDYLNEIVREYEKLYKKFPYDTPTVPISKLTTLGKFIAEDSRTESFFQSARRVRQDLHNLLISE